MTVDLDALSITLPAGETIGFRFDPARRTALLEGLDEIGATLKAATGIAAFEAADRMARPWIYDVRFLQGDA